MAKKYKLIVKDENGIKESEIGYQDVSKLRSDKEEHMCWKDCEYAYANKCPKVADHQKKNIADYDFIKQGYQIYQEDGELDTFSVTKCDNYKYKNPFDVKKLSYTYASWLKAALLTYYFGGENVEEAEMIRYELAQRGEIVPKGRILTKEKYLQLKKRNKA